MWTKFPSTESKRLGQDIDFVNSPEFVDHKNDYNPLGKQQPGMNEARKKQRKTIF